jgi:uncharacterized protein with FMN-binding domain
MRRAVLTLGGTAAGLAALLSFKTHSLADPAQAAGPPPASTGTSQAAANGTGYGSAVPATDKTASAGMASTTPQATGTKASTAPEASATSASSAPAAPAARTFTGAVDNTQYGPMQVAVTLTGTKITAVDVLKETNFGAESAQIDANAIPTLRSETLAAQSAHIDAVSGASYTSAGYIQSLQSALDQAGA